MSKHFELLFWIDGFQAYRRPDMNMSACGFTVTLHRDIVAAVLAAQKRTGQEPLNDLLEEPIRCAFPQLRDTLIMSNTRFFEDTWLLTGLTVPGNCACLGIDGRHYGSNFGKRDISYSPHNIDTPQQSACLLNMWLVWFNSITALLEIKRPWSSY